MHPPQATCCPVSERIHGVEVIDPYRWLEDQSSPQTRAWLNEQRAYCDSYFAKAPGRSSIQQRVRELLSAPFLSSPWSAGQLYFFSKREKEKDQPLLVTRRGLQGDDRVLVDPASRGTGPHTSVAIAAVSYDAHFLAYLVRQGGSDYAALEVHDLQRGAALSDGLPCGVCSGFAFDETGSGFYYVHRERNDVRPNYRAVFRHIYGTDRSSDEEVFFAGEQASLNLSLISSDDTGLLVFVVYSYEKDTQSSAYLYDPKRRGAPQCLFENVEAVIVPFFDGRHLLAYTDVNAPNFRIVEIDLNDPAPQHWREIVCESKRRIQDFAVAGGQVFVTRVDRFSVRLEGYSLSGEQRASIALPKHTSVDLLNATGASQQLFFTQSSLVHAPIISIYDLETGQITTCEEPRIPVHNSAVTIEEFSYTSKDASAIPLLLAYRKDLAQRGPLPTFITAYGGFGSCASPRYSAIAAYLIEQGFLYAVPAVRGGSELGEDWHRAAIRQSRQNAFDDFIAAAEWLVASGRSQRGRIAIGGGSNGGLLVGAVITQRPELFRAAVCIGPLLDMLRYHLFDRAHVWIPEYGSPIDEEDFHWLFSYSPYHRVRKDVSYPAVLFVSGDADNRCNPMHTRKMVARLQGATGSNCPVLLDYTSQWGHVPAQPLSKRVEAVADRLTFICQELGHAVG